jgi:hypothetical protein
MEITLSSEVHTAPKAASSQHWKMTKHARQAPPESNVLRMIGPHKERAFRGRNGEAARYSASHFANTSCVPVSTSDFPESQSRLHRFQGESQLLHFVLSKAGNEGTGPQVLFLVFSRFYLPISNRLFANSPFR